MPDRDLAILLTAQGADPTQGTAHLHTLTDAERWKRAGKAAGLALGVAIATIPIPLVHFVVPPLALILAGVLLLVRLQQREVLTGGGGPCPRCGAVAELEPGTPAWPVEMPCGKCGRRLVIQLSPP